jgi:hypothetical protein
MAAKPIRRKPFAYAAMAVLAVSGGAVPLGALAQIEAPPPLPFDTPKQLRDFEAVCTGIGSDARNDPRWAEYPLRVEVVGTAGQYLGQAQVTVSKGEENLVSVGCGGPWVLFRLPPGSYEVSVDVNGTTKSGRVNVGTKGQARILIRFPDIGGALSPEYVPK